jgi:hypothetical protein
MLRERTLPCAISCLSRLNQPTRTATPNNAIAKGSAGLTWRRGGDWTSCAVCDIPTGRSPIELLGGLRYCRVTLRTVWLWLGVNGLLTLDVSTEAVAHGREHPFAESMFLP